VWRIVGGWESTLVCAIPFVQLLVRPA